MLKRWNDLYVPSNIFLPSYELWPSILHFAYRCYKKQQKPMELPKWFKRLNFWVEVNCAFVTNKHFIFLKFWTKVLLKNCLFVLKFWKIISMTLCNIILSGVSFLEGKTTCYILYGDFPLPRVDSNLKVILWNKNL